MADGLKMVIYYLAPNRPEKQLAKSRRFKTSRIKVTDVRQSSIGNVSMLRYCVMNVWANFTFFIENSA